MPLLVCHLVDHAVPGVARIVDYDVDLSAAKLGCFANERLDVSVVEYVAGDCDCTSAAFVNGGGYGFGFLWTVLGVPVC
jgi:hypothetical protein